MNNGYTPGPWFVADTPPEWDRQPIMAKRSGGACGVADVYLPPYPEGGRENADLIAAAPELHEALEAFMSLDPTFREATMRQLEASARRGNNDMARAVLKARRALAKARGEDAERAVEAVNREQ